ncbi:MAG: M23 family metallopeptidase [Candidatus Helarchaeota archaeon]
MQKKYLGLIILLGIFGTIGIIYLYNSEFRYPNTLPLGQVPSIELPLYNFSTCNAIQGFGQITPDYYHNGIDFGVNATTPIRAPFAAYVDFIQFWYNDKGGHWQTNVKLWLNSQWEIEIVFESWALNETYGQLQRDAIIVNLGQYVEENQSIGNLLFHGHGAHIHFGIYDNSVAKCPHSYFTSTAKSAFDAYFFSVNYTPSWCM